MKKHCSFISVIAFVIGALYTLFSVWSIRHFGFWLILLTLVVGGIITYIIYVTWSSLAEILERLEKLEYWLKEHNQQTSSLRKTSDWVCPRCGKINSDYVGTCSCGCNKTNPQYNWPE